MKIKLLTVTVIALVLYLFANYFLTDSESINLKHENMAGANQRKFDKQILDKDMDKFAKEMQNYVTTASCEDFLVPFELTENWRFELKEEIRNILTKSIYQGLDGQDFDHVLHLAGIPLSDGKQLIGLYNTEKTNLPIIAGESGVELPHKQREVLFDYLIDNNIDGILALQEKSAYFSQETYVIGPNGQYSLLSSVLKANSSDLESAQKYTEKLLSFGVIATYQDLFVATNLEMPFEILELMLSSNTLTPSFSLLFEGELKSLAQLAMEKENVELLDFWLSKGSPAILEPTQANLLDLLEPPLTNEEINSKIELFQTLIKYDISPNLKNTQTRLKSWLPEKVYQRFASRIELKKSMSALVANKASVSFAVENIMSTVLAPHVRKNESLRFENPCFEAEAKRLIGAIFSNSNTMNFDLKASLNTKTRLELQKVANSHLIASHSESEVSFISRFSETESIEAKLALVRYRATNVETSIESARKRQYSKGEQERIERDDIIVNLAINGQWPQVFELLEVESFHFTIIDLLTTYAIEQSKDFNLIELLHSHGGTLSPSIMHTIVKKGDVQLAKQFKRLGLNFYQSSKKGNNAVRTAVFYKKLAMLDYLISLGVSVKPYQFGLDPLDIALINLKLGQNNPIFVRTLINAGAPIELSHKETTIDISSVNFETYLTLIQEFPELRI
mgnify:CR=1 FL=1